MADENDLNINIGVNSTGVEQGSRRTKAAMSGVTQNAKELDQAFRRIKSAIDPTFAAQEKYNRAVDANNKLLQAGKVTTSEWANAQVALRSALDASVEAINRRTAAGRQAAAQARAAAQEEKAQAAQVAAAARVSAREKAAAEKQASKEAAAAEKAAKAESREAARAAAEEAKRLAREKSAAERQASREAAEAEKAAKREMRQAARDSASAAATAAKSASAARRQEAAAARDAAKSVEDLARAEKRAAAAANELRASINPTFAAQERYNETMRRATQLLMQNKLQTGEWVSIQKQAKAQMDVNVRSLGRMNAMSVQLGYQMQDVTASLASGINPMVILAQQGGQTAAALSTMGGTAGRVAAFFAGPWGAAIIGATLVIGYLWDSQKEGKKTTTDLMDAESRRIATVQELTEALRDFNKEQREANTNETEALRIKGQSVGQGADEAKKKLLEAQADVTRLKQNMDALLATPSPEMGAALGVMQVQLARAESRVKALQKEVKLFSNTGTELAITQALRDSEAAADPLVAIRRDYDIVEAGLNDTFRKQADALKALFGEERSLAAVEQLKLKLTKDLTNARTLLAKAEENIAKARRETTKSTAGYETYGQPIDGGTISQKFGHRERFKTDNGKWSSSDHGGIDIRASMGTAIRATQDGLVKFAQWAGGYGRTVEIEHGAGVKTLYAHMNEMLVKEGQQVNKGDIIGRVGRSGNTTGPHLHYEVSVNGKKVDPTKGFFPIDRLKQEKDAIKELAEAAADLAQQQAAAIEKQQAAVEADTTKSNEEQMSMLLDLQDQKIAALQAGYGAESKEVEGAERQKYDIIRKYNQLILRDQTDTLRRQQQIAEVQAESVDRIFAEKSGQKGDAVDFKESAGIITARQGVKERAQILDEEYNQQVAHQERMYQLKLSYLQRELALENQTPERRREINSQIEIMQAEHQGRMEVIGAQFARAVAQVNQQQANVTMGKWREVASTLTQSLNSTFQGFWTRSLSWQQGMLNIADSLVYKFFDMGSKILENWLVTTLGMGQAAAAGETAITAAKTSGAAAQTAVGASAATAELGQRAATAAAGAYSSTVVIPFIGPVAAPAAAALALAAVLGFASLISAEGGMGEVPSDQLAMVHKKEMILPAWIAEPLRQGISTRGSGGLFNGARENASSVRNQTTNNGPQMNFRYQPQHNNYDADLGTMLRRDASAMRKWLRNEMRNNNGMGFSG